MITHAYDLSDEISITVAGKVVDADGVYQNLVGQYDSGIYVFVTDIRQGIDGFSGFSDSFFDPKYFMTSSMAQSSATFNVSDFSVFDGVSIAYEPGFNWVDEFDISDPSAIVETEDWNNFVSYMRYPKGNEMVPGPYALLEFNAFTTKDSGVDPDTGEPMGINEGVEMLLFAATDPSNTFEEWLNWFPNQAEFILLTGQKFDSVSLDGDEIMLGQFFVKIDEVTISSGGYSDNFTIATNPTRKRSGLPIWLPSVIQ